MIQTTSTIAQGCDEVFITHALSWAEKLSMFQTNITEVAIAVVVAFTVFKIVKEICWYAAYCSDNEVRCAELEFEEPDAE